MDVHFTSINEFQFSLVQLQPLHIFRSSIEQYAETVAGIVYLNQLDMSDQFVSMLRLYEKLRTCRDSQS